MIPNAQLAGVWEKQLEQSRVRGPVQPGASSDEAYTHRREADEAYTHRRKADKKVLGLGCWHMEFAHTEVEEWSD